DLTVYENMRFYGGIYGMTKKDIMNRIDYFLHKLDLEDIRNKQVKGIPLGWRQKLAFCVAILHDPPLVFLDEPTSGVDPVTRRQFWNMIYETAYKGTTVFITTHYMDEAEYCTRVSIMKEGEIKALDKPKELKRKFGAENMNQVFLNIAGRNR
ncbi:MAG: ABC transporter ATP-binding protein, partial [bacterium]